MSTSFQSILLASPVTSWDKQLTSSPTGIWLRAFYFYHSQLAQCYNLWTQNKRSCSHAALFVSDYQDASLMPMLMKFYLLQSVWIHATVSFLDFSLFFNCSIWVFDQMFGKKTLHHKVFTYQGWNSPGITAATWWEKNVINPTMRGICQTSKIKTKQKHPKQQEEKVQSSPDFYICVDMCRYSQCLDGAFSHSMWL